MGPVASLVSTPFDLLKIQLQLDRASARRYRSTAHAVVCIVKEHGPTALYKYVCTAVRCMCGLVVGLPWQA